MDIESISAHTIPIKSVKSTMFATSIKRGKNMYAKIGFGLGLMHFSGMAVYGKAS
jgi:hypothetical protein